MKDALFEKLYGGSENINLCNINLYLQENDIRNGVLEIYAIIRQARTEEKGLFRLGFVDAGNLEIGSIEFTENITPEEGIAYIRKEMKLDE